MKILHFHPDWRYSKSFVKPIIDCENKSGFQSEIIFERGAPAGNKNIKFDLNFVMLLMAPISLFRLWREIKLKKPDIVIAHNTRSAFLPLCAARLTRSKNIIYFNHGIPYVGYRGMLRYLLYSLETMNCCLAHNVFTVSFRMSDLLTNLPLSKPVHVIWNGSACGIDLEKFNPMQVEKINWRKQSDFEPEDFVVAFIGRAVERKGFFIAVDIWKFGLVGSKVKLVIFGVQESEFLKSYRSPPVNVTSYGFAENLHEILPHCDLLILPSRHEGFSYAVLEAAASGVPVLVSNTISSDVNICDGENGLVVKNSSPQDFADVINEVVEDKIPLDQIKENAFALTKKYCRSEFTRKYIELICSITGKNIET